MANIGRGISGAASGASAGSAIMPGVGTVVGGVLGGLAGLFGGGGPSPEEIAAQRIQDAYGELMILPPEQRRIQLEYLKSVGQITPEMEQEILQQDTQLKGLRMDPALKQKQMLALERLSQQGREGLTLEDRAALEQVQRETAQAQRGQEEAILQNMQARGMGGAGSELAARLQASQSSADRASQSGLNIAAQAQQRALQAALSSGKLAGEMGSQEFEQKAKVASAQDLINQFNTGSRQKVQQRNIDARNQAQMANLRDAQAREANRVATLNAQRQGDVQANLDYANARNQQILGRAGAGAGVAAAQTQGRQREDEGFAGVMGGLGAIASNVGNTKWQIPDWMKGDSKKLSAGELAANAGQGPLSNTNYKNPEADDPFKKTWGVKL
jgi:hypothetical protein